MNKASVKKILDHPDRDEIISKLVADEDAVALNDWLKTKYSDVKFILSVDLIKTFKEESLDMYLHLRDDMVKAKAVKSVGLQLDGTIKKNKKYKERLAELADQEIDIKKTVKQLVAAIEARAEQVFDHIQENPDDFKVDNTLIQYFTLLMNALERCNKIVNESPDQIIQHNHSFQLADQQTAVIIDTIKEILSHIDYEASLYFMERYHEAMAALKPPEEFRPVPTEVRLAEAKILSEKVGEKISE